jgi:hypothetical protein
MMEDFWLPRREGGKGTEITTLPGGQNLGELEDVKYFEKKLYKALNVPVSRLNPETSGFSLGRSTEITRDEVKFAKFVERLRNKFADLFEQALRVQCVLKGICTAEEFDSFKENIHYNFIQDNNFSELKDAELMTNRLTLLSAIDPYTGRYFSQEWIQQNVLRLTDDEIAEMNAQIDKEKEQGLGLPVGVTNDIASQQMGASIQTDAQAQQQQNQMDMDQANAEHQHELDMKAAKAAPKPAAKKEEVFAKLKRIL